MPLKFSFFSKFQINFHINGIPRSAPFPFISVSSKKGAGKVFAEWENSCERSSRNARHLAMDGPNTEAPALTRRLLRHSAHRARLAEKALESLLDAGAIGARSEVSEDSHVCNLGKLRSLSEEITSSAELFRPSTPGLKLSKVYWLFKRNSKPPAHLFVSKKSFLLVLLRLIFVCWRRNRPNNSEWVAAITKTVSPRQQSNCLVYGLRGSRFTLPWPRFHVYLLSSCPRHRKLNWSWRSRL